MDKEIQDRLKDIENDPGYKEWFEKRGSKLFPEFKEMWHEVANLSKKYILAADGNMMTAYLLSNVYVAQAEALNVYIQANFGSPPEMTDEAARLVRSATREQIRERLNIGKQ